MKCLGKTLSVTIFFLLNILNSISAEEEKNVCAVEKIINTTIYEVNGCIIEQKDVPMEFKYLQFSIIETIVFNESVIEYMPQSIFQTFEVLQNLNMSYVQMTAMGRGAFKRAKILTVLDLYGNSIPKLEEHVFEGAPNLQYLNLSFNDLKEVHATAFNGLTILKQLALAENQIQVIHPDTFIDCQELTTVNISHNQITYLPSNVFAYNPNLQILDVSYNLLYQFDMYFPVNQLCILDLSSNKVPAVSIKFNETNEVECTTAITLKADSNQIHTLTVPDSYQFEILSLNDNLMYDLNNITSRQQIKQLFLSRNPLNKDEIIQIPNLFNLENLTLSHINITSFNFDMLVNLTQLIEFDISDNALTTLDLSVVRSLQELRWLNISNNRLSHIDEDYLRPQFPNLKSMDINMNRWGCQYLKTMLHNSFKRQRINALPRKGEIQVKNRPNVDGISCLQELTTGHLENFQKDLQNELDAIKKSSSDSSEQQDIGLKEVEASINSIMQKIEESSQQIIQKILEIEDKFNTLEKRLLNLADLNDEAMRRIIKLLDGD